MSKKLTTEFEGCANSNPAGLPKAKLIKDIRDFKMEPGINTALFILAGAFSKKKTLNGDPYALHCITVGDPTNDDLSENEIIVGLLHDLLEDTDWTIKDLKTVGFSDEIVTSIIALTKKPNEKYLDSVKRCSRFPIARTVKRRDNKHNMDLTRFAKTPSPKQTYLYPISWAYLGLVNRGAIPLGTSMWKFLQMPDYQKLLTPESYQFIAAAITEKPPLSIKKRFVELKPVLPPHS
jgi:hypothetical protein